MKRSQNSILACFLTPNWPKAYNEHRKHLKHIGPAKRTLELTKSSQKTTKFPNFDHHSTKICQNRPILHTFALYLSKLPKMEETRGNHGEKPGSPRLTETHRDLPRLTETYRDSTEACTEASTETYRDLPRLYRDLARLFQLSFRNFGFFPKKPCRFQQIMEKQASNMQKI